MAGDQRGPRNGYWKGGRSVLPTGYVAIPAAVTGRSASLEHRHVMESHLGRPLSPGEVIHHINGDKTDNRIENLRLYANHAEHMRDAHGFTSARNGGSPEARAKISAALKARWAERKR